MEANLEEDIKKQTAVLEQIRDHYFPQTGPVKIILRFFVRIICIVVAYLGIAETVDWVVNTRVSEDLAKHYAAIAQRLFYEDGNATGAVQCYEKAVELDHGESDYRIALMLMKGMALISDFIGTERALTVDERRQVSRVLAEAKLLHETEAENPMPLVLVAQALLLIGDKTAAVDAVKRAVALAPDDASVHTSACAVHFFAGLLAEAEREFAEAERLNASLPLVTFWKGRLKLARNDVAGAKSAFEDMTRRFPRLPIGHALLGQVLMVDGKTEGKTIRAVFNKVLVQDARNTNAMLGIAETYEREDNFILARLWLNRVLATDAVNLSAFTARARIHAKMGRNEDALADLTSAVDLMPFKPDLYRQRAQLYDKLGDVPRAKSDRATADALEKDKLIVPKN